MNIGDKLPEVTFQTRVHDETIGEQNPFRWQPYTTDDYFGGRRVLLFALPGAFTPTCSTYQLPGFEQAATELKRLGIDEVYCLSVNDAFVMNQWAQSLGLSHVRMIPDGSAAFTQQMGMLVRKDNLGFGARSWRYAAIVDDSRIEAWFEEPGRADDCPDDPYGATSPEAILNWLRDQARQFPAA